MRMIVLVGPPAAGKSTYVQKNFADIEHRLISTDAILEDYAALDGITYNEAFKKYSPEMDQIMWGELCQAYADQADLIIVDRTNMSIKSRRRFVQTAIDNGYVVDAVVFPVPEQVEWNRRLNNRPGKTIPDFVIDSMLRSFQMPSDMEGFNSVTVYGDE